MVKAACWVVASAVKSRRTTRELRFTECVVLVGATSTMWVTLGVAPHLRAHAGGDSGIVSLYVARRTR
jgi:hypothetical protein